MAIKYTYKDANDTKLRFYIDGIITVAMGIDADWIEMDEIETKKLYLAMKEYYEKE